MSLPQLPLLPQLQIILNLTPPELLNYCRSSQEALFACSLPEYMEPYLEHYGFKPEQIPGDTFQKKLRFLTGFNWTSSRPGYTAPELGRYISETMELAKQVNPGAFVRKMGPIPGDVSIPYDINDSFTAVIDRAARLGNPRFVELILNTLIQRVGAANFRYYVHSFRDPLVTTLRYAQMNSLTARIPLIQIANLFLKYYNAKDDQILEEIYESSFCDGGDLPTTLGLFMIFPPDEEGFWYAVRNDRTALAHLLWNHLRRKGIDPVADPKKVKYYYEYFIEDGEEYFPHIELLSVFAQPTQDIVDYTERKYGSDDKITEFLKTKLYADI